MVPFERSWIPRAVEMLCRAFEYDSMFTNYFPDPKQRKKAAEPFLAGPVYLGLMTGEVYTTSAAVEGMAVWFPPGADIFRASAFFRAIPFREIVRFIFSGVSRMRPLGEFFEQQHKALAPAEHWYLQLLGVDPDRQGSGLSSTLLRPMHERLDRDGVPCYLETTSERNVGLYEHFGYRVMDSGRVPDTRIEYWAMLRPVVRS